MQLTTAEVARFVGGQIEVQNEGEGYIFRGEIATAVVENNQFRVTLLWVAKGLFKAFPIVERWINDTNLEYVVSLEIYSVSNMGRGSEGGSRLCLKSMIIGELVLLIPPDGSKLDRARVEGLEPVPA